MTATTDQIESFIADWAVTGGSELANTQSFINGLAAIIGVDPPNGSRDDNAHNDYVFERTVFQDNGDGTTSFGRLDAYKRDCFVLEAKQGTDADREAAKRGESRFLRQARHRKAETRHCQTRHAGMGRRDDQGQGAGRTLCQGFAR